MPPSRRYAAALLLALAGCVSSWRGVPAAAPGATGASHLAATRRAAQPPLLPRRAGRRCAHPQLSQPANTETKVSTADDESADEMRDALVQTAATVAAACAFCAGVFAMRGGEDASAWFAAYVLEESLSIDNLFVFSLIFDYFQTPAMAQPRVLRYGLLVAVVLRLSFIVAGLAVVERFKGILLVFAGVLLYSAYGLLTEGDDEEEDLSQNAIVQFTKNYLPSTDVYDGDRFFTAAAAASADGGSGGGSGSSSVDGPGGALARLLGGEGRVATPLLLALVCVELSDVVFAVDSIPAVFGVTTDPFIAFTSNAFALLGLRALYTVISEAVDSFQYLKPAIALVLGFIGLKLVGEFVGIEVDTVTSLLVVLGTLSAGVGASVALGGSDEE